MTSIFDDAWGSSLTKMLDFHWTPATGLRVSVDEGMRCLNQLRSSRLSATELRKSAELQVKMHTRRHQHGEAKEASDMALLEWQRGVWLDENIANLSRAIFAAETEGLFAPACDTGDLN